MTIEMVTTNPNRNPRAHSAIGFREGFCPTCDHLWRKPILGGKYLSAAQNRSERDSVRIGLFYARSRASAYIPT